MATLKEHQAAMVDLLANGSGIPASASRLAHAMHDVLNLITGCTGDEIEKYMRDIVRKTSDATSLGLNDKALSDCVEACRPIPDNFDRAIAAERRVKELENTIKQLKGQMAGAKATIKSLKAERDANAAALRHALKLKEPEQAGCRRSDTQMCEHVWFDMPGLFIAEGDARNVAAYELCQKCGAKR